MPNNLQVTFALATKRDRADYPGSAIRIYKQPFLIHYAQVDADNVPITLEPYPLSGTVFDNVDYIGLGANVATDVQLFQHVAGVGGNEERLIRWLDDHDVSTSYKLEFEFRRFMIAIVGGDPSSIL